MGELPVLKPKDVARIFEKIGYVAHRQKGSHLILIKPGTPFQIVIPMHSRDLAKGTLRAIIRQSKKTVDEFLEYL